MNSLDTNKLKQIADGLASLGKPGRDTISQAKKRLMLMEEFETLVRAASPADRHELAQTLLAMLRPV